jgi:hypothetical protein
MTDLAERARDLAIAAERAAVERQHAGLAGGPAGPGAGPAVIGALQLVADNLWAATRALGLPPALNRRPESWAVVTASLMVVLTTTALLLVPHPIRPWALAVVVPACAWASQLLWRAGRAVHDHRVPPAPARPLAELLTELRDGLTAIAVALEPADREEHLTAGRHLELAHVWLDDAEIEARTAP